MTASGATGWRAATTARGRDGKRQLIPDYWVRGISPAAGFISTVEDLGRFASWQFRVLDGDDALLDRNTLREMHRVHWLEPDGDTTYGLGFSVWKSDGDTFVGHGGSCPGYRSHLLLRPQDKVATAFMTNGQGVDSRRFAQTAFDIVAPALRKAAGKPNGDTPASAVPTGSEGEATTARETLMGFTGTYQRPLGGESAVLLREGDLHVLSLPTDDPLDSLTRLRHIEDGTFRRVRDNGVSVGRHADPGDGGVSTTNPRSEHPEPGRRGHLVVLAPRRSRLSAEPGDHRGDLGHVHTHRFGRQHRRIGLARVPPDLHAEFGRSLRQGLAVEHAVCGMGQGT